MGYSFLIDGNVGFSYNLKKEREISLRKIITLALIFVSLTSLCSVAFQSTRANPRTLVVPDDYSTIQAAVDNATAGDTVFVKKGTYREEVGINKPLSLIGEDRSSTVIMGRWLSYGQPPAVISIDRNTSNVTISGFTLTGDSNAGMWINEAASNCKVTNNIVTNNSDGIHTFAEIDSPNILISGNLVTNNRGFGIYCGTPNTTISGNNILDNGAAGVIIDSAFDVTVSGNNITGNGANSVGDPTIAGGLFLRWSGPFNVYGNTISNNQGYGIQFGEGCNNSTVHENNITGNVVGINLQNFISGGDANIGQGNFVYQNNLVNNSQQVIVEKANRVAAGDATLINGTDKVSWDNGKEGNYWSDYLTKYPSATEVDSSGIGNTPYVIDATNTDHYPIMKPAELPEFPSWIILSVIITSAILLAAGFRRKNRLKV
jgi:nitrous oxidase accessory protein NosD